jgi:hypothetical protein
MISAVLLVSVALMENRHRQKGWREEETMEDAAARLLAVLEQRVEKRKNSAGEDLGRRQFADQQPTRSLVGLAEKSGRDSERKHGSTALKLPGRQLTPPQGGGIGGDPVAEVGRSNGMGNTGGQADFGISSSLKYKDTTRPALDEALADRPRRYPDAPEDGL